MRALLRRFSSLEKLHLNVNQTIIKVIQGSIRNEVVGGVVNFIDQKLNLEQSELASLLTQKGKQFMQEECNEWVKRNGLVNFGSAAITRPADLFCDHVIHAAVPQNERIVPSSYILADKRKINSFIEQTFEEFANEGYLDNNSLKKALYTLAERIGIDESINPEIDENLSELKDKNIDYNSYEKFVHEMSTIKNFKVPEQPESSPIYNSL